MANEFDEDAFLDALSERAQRLTAGEFLKERIIERTDVCCLNSLADAPGYIPNWIGDIQSTAEGLEEETDPKARREALWNIAGAALAALAMDGALRDGAESEDVEPTVDEMVERDSEFFARNAVFLAPIYLGEKERTYASPEGTEERAWEEEISGKVGKQILGWWDEYKAEHAGQPDQEIRAGFDPWLRAKAKELGVAKAKKRYAKLHAEPDGVEHAAAPCPPKAP